ncbi:MAG: PDZ domain-containing protein [Gemmatales bacterium]
MNRLAKYLLVFGLVASPALAVSATAHEPWRDGFQHRNHPREGLRVTSVVRFSPAARAGLDRGDIILEVDGRDVNHPEELHRLLHRTGQRAVLKVWDDETRRVRIVHVFPRDGHIGVTLQAVRF